MNTKELLEGWQRDGKPWFDERTIKLLVTFIEVENEDYHTKQLKLCGVVSTSSCGTCGGEDIDIDEKWCNTCNDYID